MPADPYTLGIGVEIDQRATVDALDSFTKQVERWTGDLRRETTGIGDLIEAGFPPDMLLKAFNWNPVDEARLKILAAEKAADTASEKMKTALSAIGEVAESAFSKVGDFVDFFRFGSDVTKPAEDLEAATQRMAATMGNGRTEAKSLRTEIYSLAETTGYSLEQTTELERGLADTGHTLGSFTKETQVGLATLSTQFGVSGEEGSRMASSISSLGGDLNGLLGEATGFTKGFKLPGLFQELPHLVEDARHATLTFSASVVGTGKDVVAATANMAGVFAKSFGTTIADGLTRAQSALNKVRGAAQQDADVFLGLGTEFSGLTMAIMQTGRGIGGAMDIVRKAGKGNLGALEDLATIKDRMPEGIMKDRFVRQLQKELPEDMLALVMDVDKLHAAMSDKKAAEDFEKSIGGQGVKSFNELGKSVLDTTAGFRSMFDNALVLAQSVLMTSGVTDVLRDVLGSAKDTFQGFANSIRAFTESKDFQKRVAEWKPVITSALSSLLKIGTVITTVGGAVIGLGSSFWAATEGISSAGGVFSKFGKMVPGVGGLFESLGGVFKGFGGSVAKIFGKVGPIGEVIGAFEGIKEAVTDMGATLGDPNATGMEKLEALFRGGLKGIGKFFDTILLGIPGKIAGIFFPDLELQFDVGVSGFFKKVGDFFSGGGPGIMGTISKTVGGWLDSVGGFMLDHLPDIKGFAASFGKSLGGVLGGALHFAMDVLVGELKFMWNLLSGKFFTGGSNLGGDFNDGVVNGIYGVIESFAVVGEGLKTFFASVFDGILGAFGVNSKMLLISYEIMWEKISNGASIGWNYLKGGFLGLTDTIGSAVLTLWMKARGIWNDLGSQIASMMSDAKTDGEVAMIGIRLAIFSLVNEAVPAFRNLAETVIGSLNAIVTSLPAMTPGIDTMKTALQEATTAVSALGVGFAVSEAAARSDLAQALDAGKAREATIKREHDLQEASLKDEQAGQDAYYQNLQNQRKLDAENRDRTHETKISQLRAELAEAQVSFDTEQEHATEARRFHTAAQTQMEQALQSIGTAATGMSRDSARDATNSLREFMNTQVKTIEDDVAKGSITTAEAAARLQQAAAKGLVDAKAKLKQEEAGDVANAAGGPGQTAAGLNKEAVAQLMRNVRGEIATAQRAAQPQQMQMRISADGDVSRALARGSQFRQLNQTGGAH